MAAEEVAVLDVVAHDGDCMGVLVVEDVGTDAFSLDVKPVIRIRLEEATLQSTLRWDRTPDFKERM